MITVTLDKETYDNLIKYKEAYENNEIILEFSGNVNMVNHIGYEYTRIKFIEISDAIKLMADKIKELETEKSQPKIVFKPKKWWQLW